MKDFKLTALDGGAARSQFVEGYGVVTDPERLVCVAAVEMDSTPGDVLPLGVTGDSVEVLRNDGEIISVCRSGAGAPSNNKMAGKVITLRIVAKGAPAPRTPKTPATTPAPAPAPAIPTPGGAVAQDIAAAIMAAINPAVAAAVGAAMPAPAPAEIDADAVREIVNAEIEKVREANTTRVVINELPPVEMEGETLHPQFSRVIKNLKRGNIPYLYGPAGTGKTTAAAQAAKALNLPFYCVGALCQKYELEGFADATGKLVESELYKCMTTGGVFMFDEIDSTAAEVLVAFNNLLANKFYTFPVVGRVGMPENMYIIVAGNTCGRGADIAYNGRYQLDASTLDRFAFIEMNYTPEIDRAAARKDMELIRFSEELRRVIKSAGLPYTVSPRGLERIALAVLDGDDLNTALLEGMCGGWAPEHIVTIAAQLNGEGKYFNAFKNLKH